MIHIIASDHHQMSSSYFFPGLRLTLGDMYGNQGPRNYKNKHERGPGGSVWAKTLSKRRSEAQDHFPTPPGTKNPFIKIKKNEMLKILIFTKAIHYI